MKTYAQYLFDAETAFLKEAAKLIRAKAGEHCGECEVQSTSNKAYVFLTYKGEDRSDRGYNFTAQLIHEREGYVKINISGDTTRGSFSEDTGAFLTGMLDPEHIANLFAERFG